MKKNMGSIDRMFRISVAIGIGILYFTNVISGLTALILAGIAIVFIITSFVSFCPLYLPFKISTAKKRDL